MEHDDCLWIFGADGVSLDGYLNEYGHFRYVFIYLSQEDLRSRSASCSLLVLMAMDILFIIL